MTKSDEISKDFIESIGCGHGKCQTCDLLKRDAGPCYDWKTRNAYNHASTNLDDYLKSIGG